MAGYYATSNVENSWKWQRVCGMSGAVALHFVALALIALPIAITAPVAQRESAPIAIIERPIEPPSLPIPEEPQPLPRAPRIIQPVRLAPPPMPTITAESAISLPSPTLSDSLATAAVNVLSSQTPTLPGSNSVLAYESTVEPIYPADAKRRREQGTVLLRVRVGSNGFPELVEIARSSGSFRLDRAGREAVLRWRFRPVQIDGRAIPAEGLVPIAFHLDHA